MLMYDLFLNLEPLPVLELVEWKTKRDRLFPVRIRDKKPYSLLTDSRLIATVSCEKQDRDKTIEIFHNALKCSPFTLPPVNPFMSWVYANHIPGAVDTIGAVIVFADKETDRLLLSGNESALARHESWISALLQGTGSKTVLDDCYRSDRIKPFSTM